MTAVYMTMRVLGIGPVATLLAQGVLEERDVVIEADFDDNTGDSTLAFALSGAIQTDLTQSPTMTVMSPGDLAAALQRMERAPQVHVTPALAREIAMREGVKAVLAIDELSSKLRERIGEFSENHSSLAIPLSSYHGVPPRLAALHQGTRSRGSG